MLRCTCVIVLLPLTSVDLCHPSVISTGEGGFSEVKVCAVFILVSLHSSVHMSDSLTISTSDLLLFCVADVFNDFDISDESSVAFSGILNYSVADLQHHYIEWKLNDKKG